MKVHLFNVDEAVKYGVEKAVIIYNLRYWLEKNKANDTNKHDGYYWTYNSAKAFSELFPYFKERKIARLLTQLEEENVILAGHFNKKGYDRTKWYSMPEFAVETQEDDVDLSEETGSNPCGTPFVKSDKCICQICQIHLSKMTNPFVKNDQPIPNVNQIENTDSKPDDTNGEQKNGESDNGESKSKTKKRGKKKQEVDFEPRDYPIPSYIDKELWIAYHDMRDGKKAKATEYACKLLVKKFEQWHQEGLDVRPAIEASIISRWTDVFKNKAVQLQQTNKTWGNNYANNQSANQTANQPASHFDQLRQELELKYGEHGYTDNGIKTVN